MEKVTDEMVNQAKRNAKYDAYRFAGYILNLDSTCYSLEMIEAVTNLIKVFKDTNSVGEASVQPLYSGQNRSYQRPPDFDQLRAELTGKSCQVSNLDRYEDSMDEFMNELKKRVTKQQSEMGRSEK